jgi:hypothetical protein
VPKGKLKKRKRLYVLHSSNCSVFKRYFIQTSTLRYAKYAERCFPCHLSQEHNSKLTESLSRPRGPLVVRGRHFVHQSGCFLLYRYKRDISTVLCQADETSCVVACYMVLRESASCVAGEWPGCAPGYVTLTARTGTVQPKVTQHLAACCRLSLQPSLRIHCFSC